MTTEEFGTDAVLSVYTGFHVCRGGFDKVHQLIEYMAGSPVFTHSLPRVAELAQPTLLDQFPWLADVGKPQDGKWEEWLDAIVEERGAALMVSPMATPPEPTDPINELREMTDAPIMVVHTGRRSG